MSSNSGNLVTKVVSLLLFYSFVLATSMASAYTYTGSTATPQGKFYDSTGKPITVSKIANGNISFSNNNVAKIGSYAFHNCSGLKSFELPPTVTEVGFFAFSNCNNLTNPICNSTVFARLPKSEVSYGIVSGTKTIASGAFRQCTNLATVTIPSSVTKIEESAFSGCTALTSITIPASIESIGDYAFFNCTKLSSIYMETSKITGISSKAFEGVNKKTCVLFVPAGKTTSFSNLGFEHVIEIPEDNGTDTPVVVITGSYSGDSFSAINKYVNDTKALVVDLTNATEINGKFTPDNKNVIYKTSKEASVLKLQNTENVVVNGVCKKFVLSDGFAFGTDEEFTATKATYSRTITASWGTICLPFVVKSNDIIQYYTSGSVTNNVLTLEPTSVVNPGTPAIFKRISGTNYEVVRTSEKVKPGIVEPTNSNSSNNIQLYGTFTKKELVEEGLYYISNDKFWLKTEGSPLIVNPFRAWFTFGASHANGRSLTIEESNEETASLKAIDAMTNGTAQYFDEQGVPQQDLQKGMNIVRMPDGSTKKIFLK